MPVSKSRRPGRPRKPSRTAGAAAPAGRSLPAHAHLTDAGGQVVGGAALRDAEWAVVLRGRVAATTDSPGMVLAMLRHASTLLAVDGAPLALRYSDTLRDLATQEAALSDRTLEEWLDYLEAERAENAGRADGTAH